MNEDPAQPTLAPAGSGTVGLGEAISRYLWLIIAVAVVGGSLGWSASLFLPENYRAETTLYLSDPTTTSVFGAAQPVPSGSGLLRSSLDMAGSLELLNEVATDLGGVDAEEVGQRIVVTGDESADALRVSATADSPTAASSTLDSFVTTFERRITRSRQAWAERAAEQLEPFEAALSTRIADIDRRLTEPIEDGEPGIDALAEERAALFDRLLLVQLRSRELTADAAVTGAGTLRMDAVELPTEPVTPPARLTTAAGVLAGLLLAIGVAWRRTERSPRIRERRDAFHLFGIPSIGDLPSYEGTSPPTVSRWGFGPSRARTERLRLGTLLRPLGPDTATPPVVQVRGVRPRDQAERVAFALGTAAARTGRRVLVCGIAPRPDGAARPRSDAASVPTTAGGTSTSSRSFVVGDGTLRLTPDPWPPANSSADLIVIASPPLLSPPDTAPDTPVHGAKVVLALHRDCPVDALAEAIEVIQLEGGTLLGYVYVEAPATSGRRTRAQAAGLNRVRVGSSSSTRTA